MMKKEQNFLINLFKTLSPKDQEVKTALIPKELKSCFLASLPFKPKAILFDIYGTLLSSAAGDEFYTKESKENIQKETNPAFKLLQTELDHIKYKHDTNFFINEIASLINQNREKLLEKTNNPEINIEVILSKFFPRLHPKRVRYFAIILESCLNPCFSMPDAVKVLSILKNNNVPMGIVSNAQFYTPMLLAAHFGKLFISSTFHNSFSFFSYKYGIAKPDLFLFEKAAQALWKKGIKQQDTLVLGNSAKNDIAPAHEVGFMTALFAGDEKSFRPPELNPVNNQELPDIIITKLIQLLDYFKL